MKVNRCVSCMKEIESYPCPHCGFDPGTQPQPDCALPWNTILHGKFLAGRVLGRGGFGITYMGWDLALEMKVAIKEYFPSGQVVRQSGGSGALNWSGSVQGETDRRTGMESFVKEARKMAWVDRVPEVVRVRDTFYENGTAYIVMDFVEGETLKTRLEREGPLSFDAAMEVFRPVLTAMERVHKEGLIHRDISPDNIMLEPGGGVRILDLGAAKDLTVNQGASSMNVAKGGFSPLEQYGQRGGSGTWTDVYAMAATIYYTLTGIVPPNAADRADGDELRWDLPALEAVPAPAREALKKAMTVSSKDRTQTMAEFMAGLETWEPEDKGRGEPLDKPGSGSKPKPRKKLLTIALACAAVVAVVIWALGGRGGGENANSPSTLAVPTAEATDVPTATPVPTPTPTLEPHNVIASGEAGESVTWSLDDAGVMTISGSGEMESFYYREEHPWDSYEDQITAVVVDRGVTGVGCYAFYGYSSLTSVTFPDRLQTIGSDAFYECRSLTSVVLPDGLQTIGEWAFGECRSLTSVTFPDGLSTIGEKSFFECSALTSVTFPAELQAIEECAFDYCGGLTSVTLPQGVSTIEQGAFANCGSLTDVYYGGSETQWMDIEIGTNNENLLNARIHYSS